MRNIQDSLIPGGQFNGGWTHELRERVLQLEKQLGQVLMGQ